MYLPALASIGREFAASPAATQATLALFFLGFALGQLVYGPLADRYGRRRPLLAGLAIYVVASLGCALASSVSLLSAARLVQALGASAGAVISRAVVRDLFEVVDAARIYSRLMLIVGIAPILAPLLGGQLLLFASWRAIFVVLALFGATSLLAVMRWLPETHSGPRASARPATVVRGWWAIIRDVEFRWPALAAATGFASLLTYVLGAPAVLITGYGVTPQHFGLFFAMNAIGLIGGAQLNAHWLRRHSPRQILRRAAPVLLASGVVVAYATWSGHGGLWGTVAAWFLQLTTLGFVTANATATALHTQAARAGSAAALLGAMQFGSGAIAGALVGALSTLAVVGTAPRAVGLVICLCAVAACAAARRATRD